MSNVIVFIIIFVGLLIFGIVCFISGIRFGLYKLFDTWVDNLDDDELDTLVYLAKKGVHYNVQNGGKR